MAQMQRFEKVNRKIDDDFGKLKKGHQLTEKRQLKLSWSNWGFGREPLSVSCARLARAGISYIELHGNHYGADLGYKVDETRRVLSDNGVRCAGVCGMFSRENDLSSNNAIHRQRAVDYIRREVEFTAEVGGTYLLVVPAAVGRPTPYDAMEFERSVETLRLAGDFFTSHRIRAAIEPIRSAEVSIVHTLEEAKRYIKAVNCKGVRHINGDVYHMQTEEAHIAAAIRDAGEMLINLHMADSNRCGLGEGSLDLDRIIKALYLIGYDRDNSFVTPEPLGPGGDPYPAMHGKPDPRALDKMVLGTARYFRERETAVWEQ
jgi:D-psicose/D-tagatose/L-ribulose 3-epimerase